VTGPSPYALGDLEAQPGSQVRGHCVEDAFGDTVQEILAPVAGVLTFGLGSLAAAPGDLLASIARPLPRG
jgi:hypothetical protein